MQINKCSSTSFQARFINNKAMKEVVEFASNTNQLRTLDHALNKLAQYNKGDITIYHGKIDNKIFSNFSAGRRGCQNLAGEAKTPAEASFNNILKLAAIGGKFRKLFGKPIVELTEADIFARLA